MLSQIEADSKGNIHYAGNQLQWNFLNGFIKNLKEKVFCLTAPMVGSYPYFHRRFYIKKMRFMDKEFEGISIGYLNLPLIKKKSIEISIKKELRNISKHRVAEPVRLVLYGMHIEYMRAAIYAKKIIPNLKLTLIVPDLPQYYSNFEGIIWKIREYFEGDSYKLVKHFDNFIVLTDEMVNLLGVSDKNWIRIEGMINSTELVSQIKDKTIGDKKIIMYSGTLAFRYSILDLISAFLRIKNLNYELWICGSGETEDYIKEISQQDSRIKYMGLVTRSKVLELQQKATVLVNPRSTEGEYTKYSFPSKTMEYLLSGKPIIMRNLPGIPDEYKDFIEITEDDTIEALEKKLIETCELSENIRIEKGTNAIRFVLEQKNYVVQTEKVLNLIR